MAKTLRAKLPKGIIAEFMPPAKKARHSRVVIICSGMPGAPSKRELMEFFSSHGFWVFAPRYRGTWESAGEFLRQSPESDIQIVIDSVRRGIRELWDGKNYKIKPEEIFIFGTSFGGPAALFLSADSRVTRTVALSPVVDWRLDSEEEPFARLGKFLKEGFGPAYRFRLSNWKKLVRGSFYNPATATERIAGAKTLVVHAKDDKVISWRPVKDLVDRTGARFILTTRGGHGSRMLTPLIRKKILRFFLQGRV